MSGFWPDRKRVKGLFPTDPESIKICLRDVCLWTGLLTLAYFTYAVLYTPLTRVLDTQDDIGEVLYSKSKHALSRESMLQHVNCAVMKCSWFEYNQTKSFSDRNKVFDIYEDETFTTDEDEPYLYCRPDTFGYTNEDAEAIFPYVGFPRCIEKFPKYRKAMYLDTVTNTLTMNCSGSFKGKYLLGTSSHNDTIALPTSYHGDVKHYTSPVSLTGSEEWALGTCDLNNENLFEQVEVKFRAREDLIEKTKAKMEEMRQELGQDVTQPRKSIIFLLVVDSASRRHFYRKFPKTLEVLKSLQANYEVTDFLIHNVIGDNSARNQIPIFTGRPRLTFKGRKSFEGTVEELYHGDALAPDTLYHYMRNMGFVTFFGFEFCHQYFAMYMGDKPQVDHLAANFWCGAREYAGFHFEKSVYGQRCIGPDMSHQHMFTYISQFTEGYEAVNQMIYTHLTAGHEATGTHIETLDLDLANFLVLYIRLAEEHGFELSILLHGDHGMRYGEWYKNIAAFQEHRLPALFSILPRSMLLRADSAYDILEHNRFRLISKLDLHLTVKSIAVLTYKSEVNRYSKEYREWKGSGYLGSALSLLLEKVPNTRGCENVFIPPFYCACMSMALVDRSIYSTDHPEYNPKHPLTVQLGKMIQFLSDFSLFITNSGGYTNTASYPAAICQKMTLDKVVSVYAQKITRGDEAFKLEFTVKEHPTARFETYTVLGNTDKYIGNKEDMEAFPAAQYFFRNRTVSARVLFIKRLDKYAGICEEIGYLKQINSALCLCNSVSTLKHTTPIEVRELFSRFTLVQSEETGRSCDDVCAKTGLKCDDFYCELLRDEELLKEFVWRDVSGYCKAAGFTGVRVSTAGKDCTIAPTYNLSNFCTGLPPSSISALCPCH